MKPILFNTAMVKAILEGKKTCTRRLIKLPKHIEKQRNGLYTLSTEGSVYTDQDFKDVVDYIKPPYKVGDILYVRETWTNTLTPDGNIGFAYKADGEPENFLWWGNAKKGKWEVWMPSIHMPKEAARIFLKVTSVRAERLKDITDEGCLNEGIREFTKDGIVKKYDTEPNMHIWEKMPRTPREAFEKLWNSTLQLKGKWNGWKNLFEYNPWVWVIEFKQIENNEVGE